jgi:glycosyltransferase involved in cell wall biosynthesis
LKKILIILPNMAGGGVERIRLILSKEFKSKGFEVEYALLNASGELLDEASRGHKIYNLRINKIRHLPFKLSKLLKEIKPEAVLASIWPVTVAAAFGVFLSGITCRLVLSEHNHLSTQYKNKGFLHNFIMRFSMFFCYRFATKIVAVSSGVKKDLEKLSLLDKQKFEVIFNPISSITIPNSEKKIEVEKMWGCKNKKRIISVGSLKKQKNHFLLINAFALVNNEIPSKLMIIGDGQERDNLKKQVQSLGLKNEVIFSGFQRDIDSFYQSADLFVLSSNYEGVGNVLLEALINGINIVSTDCNSGPAEILSNGKYGILVPVDNVKALSVAITEELKEPSINKNILKRRAEDFLPSKIASQYLELLSPKL